MRDWQGFVLELVRSEGAGKRSQARLLSWGVNGAGAALMIAVFASTAGLTGAEVAIAGGTTAVGQRLLEAVFGDNAVRELAARARADLDARADRVLRREQDRFVRAAGGGRAHSGRRRRTARRGRRAGHRPRSPRMKLGGGRRAELSLTDRLAALRAAVEVAEDRLEVPEVARARALLAKAGAREALGDATVVALAGATGSGKSTLFNALSGSEVSIPGVRRPTTGVAHASVWGEHGADRLLDWLQVPRRHRVQPAEPALDGLVLLDLPDHDSIRLENRLEVDRLVELVDVLVWVLDPQKYADAAVHSRYLAPLAGHAGVLVVVFNQVDRLDDASARRASPTCAGCSTGRGWPRRPSCPPRLAPGPGCPSCAPSSPPGWPPGGRPPTGWPPTPGPPQPRWPSTARRTPAGTAAGTGTSGRALAAALANAAGVPAVVSAVERSARRRGTSTPAGRCSAGPRSSGPTR